MDKLLLSTGRLAGAAGVVMTAIAAISRLSGHYELGGFGVAMLLLAGIAAMVFGCLCLLAVLTNTASSSR